MYRSLLFLIFAYFVGAEDSHSRGDKNDLNCVDLGDCATECNEICGCEKAYYYNATLDECVYDLEYAMNIITVEKVSALEKISSQAEVVFQSLLTSVVFITFCFIIGVVSSCYYCFRVEYTDHVLSREVKELEKRLGKKGIQTSLKRPLDPIAESCNIMIEDAGIMVV